MLAHAEEDTRRQENLDQPILGTYHLLFLHVREMGSGVFQSLVIQENTALNFRDHPRFGGDHWLRRCRNGNERQKERRADHPERLHIAPLSSIEWSVYGALSMS